MENKPKKRGRKVGSKKNTTENKEPPKKRGRKPKKKIVTNENPVFADDNLNMEDLIIKLNNDKNEQENNLSFTIDEHEEINFNKKSKLCWNCSHDFFDRIHGVPINYNSGVFHTVGDFCSVGCMARYAVDNMSDDIYNILPLINLYNSKINNNNNSKVKLAPNRLLLDIYGGDMTIDEYRNNNNILYDLKLPIIIPTNYNINKYNSKNNNNFTDLKLYRKNKPNNNNNNITKKLNID